MSEIPRTYPSWLKGEVKSAQKEYTEPTKLLADDGTLLSPGWARHMVFDYDRTKSTPTMRRKEWDFYQISDGRYMIQISFANISIGGYASAAGISEAPATDAAVCPSGAQVHWYPALVRLIRIRLAMGSSSSAINILSISLSLDHIS